MTHTDIILGLIVAPMVVSAVSFFLGFRAGWVSCARRVKEYPELYGFKRMVRP